MPIKECILNGKPGFKWGNVGKCYTYNPISESSTKEAKQKAINQGIAIGEIEISNKGDASMKLNTSGKSFLSGLISSSKINNGAWSFSGADGNKLLGPNGDDWAQYGKVHLGINPDADKDTKAYYSYPVGKMVGNEIQIFRHGVIGAKSAAAGGRGAKKQPDIEKAADDLLQSINKKQAVDKGKEKKKTKDSISTVCRYDFLEMPDPDRDDNHMEEKFKRTPEGFLKGRAIVTNVGVFPYKTGDGAVRYELRPPEEVFNHDSINTLKNVPLGNEHPNEGIIDVDNIKKHQVGYAGENVRRDEYHLSSPLIWTDGDTIEEIQGGKRGLSAGYLVDLEEKPGNWMGMPYDAIQRNIRYNHIVVTEQGRAGDNARIKMDSGDATSIQKIQNQGVKSMLKKIKIDGIEYEAEAPVIIAYTQAKAELEKIKADNSEILGKVNADHATMEAERDQLKEENENLKKDAKDSEGLKEDQMEKAVQNRLVILDTAKRAEVKVNKDMPEIDIKKEVVVKLFPGSKEKMDNANTDYLDARFDGCIEKLDEMEADGQETANHLKEDALNHEDKNAKKCDSKAAYDRMVEREQNLWKDEKEVN